MSYESMREAFCATGKGGGRDNSCSSKDGGSYSPGYASHDRKVARLPEEVRKLAMSEFGVDSLYYRGSDSLDFADVGVATIRSVADKAYSIGSGGKTMDVDAKPMFYQAIADGLGLETLDSQNSDSKDFHNIGVGSLVDVTDHAYQRGLMDKGPSKSPKRKAAAPKKPLMGNKDYKLVPGDAVTRTIGNVTVVGASENSMPAGFRIADEMANKKAGRPAGSRKPNSRGDNVKQTESYAALKNALLGRNSLVEDCATPARQKWQESTTGVAGRVDRQAGVIRGVKVLGFDSRNRREYSESTMARARHLYEGAKVYLNHDRSERERAIQDQWGVLRNVRMEEGGLYADLHYLKNHPSTAQLVEAAERFPETFGLSHNASGAESKMNGRKVVTSIDEVYSVDVVSEPATNKGLFESHSTVTLRSFLESFDHPIGKRLLEMCDACQHEHESKEYSPAEIHISSDDVMPDDTSDEKLLVAFRALMGNVLDDDSLLADEKIKRLTELLQLQSSAEKLVPSPSDGPGLPPPKTGSEPTGELESGEESELDENGEAMANTGNVADEELGDEEMADEEMSDEAVSDEAAGDEETSDDEVGDEVGDEVASDDIGGDKKKNKKPPFIKKDVTEDVDVLNTPSSGGISFEGSDEVKALKAINANLREQLEQAHCERLLLDSGREVTTVRLKALRAVKAEDRADLIESWSDPKRPLKSPPKSAAALVESADYPASREEIRRRLR